MVGYKTNIIQMGKYQLHRNPLTMEWDEIYISGEFFMGGLQNLDHVDNKPHTGIIVYLRSERTKKLRKVMIGSDSLILLGLLDFACWENLKLNNYINN